MYTKGNLIYGEIESWYDSTSADVFRSCSSVTKVTNCKLTPTGQEGSIGTQAFAWCSKLKEIVFGTSTVTTINTIGSVAFQGCPTLAKIDLGKVWRVISRNMAIYR
jgi:hypothetical protein